MKKNVVISFVITVVVFLTSCETDNSRLITNDFEDFVISSANHDNGSGKTGELINGSYQNVFMTGTLQLQNQYTDGEWGGFWGGFAMSAAVDSVTRGWANEFSTIAGSGANGSAKFALAYDTATIHLPYINSYQRPVSVMLTNSTWAYYDMKYGSDFGKVFGSGDWFKVIIRGFLGGKETGKVEFYLADFREGKSVLIREWTKVNLKSLGKTENLKFSFESSDNGKFGMNTPAYVCVDDLIVAVDEDCDCLK